MYFLAKINYKAKSVSHLDSSFALFQLFRALLFANLLAWFTPKKQHQHKTMWHFSELLFGTKISVSLNCFTKISLSLLPLVILGFVSTFQLFSALPFFRLLSKFSTSIISVLSSSGSLAFLALIFAERKFLIISCKQGWIDLWR